MISLFRRILPPLIGCMLLVAPVHALEVTLVLSHKGGAHALFAEALEANLGIGRHRLLDGGNLEEGLDEAQVARSALILASGAAAVEAALRHTDRPILAVLLSRGQYLGLRRQYPDSALSAIVLDQPVARQVALMLAVLPEGRRFGVLFGPDTTVQESELMAVAAGAGLELIGRRLSTAGELIPALDRTLESVDALLALADPLLSSSTAARAVLLSSYRYRRPVFAHSRAFVDAGALAAVFSTPADVARDVAEWLRELPDGSPTLPVARAPRYFDIAINPQVARALNLRVADAATVLARVRKETQP